jgi:WD40 repeat protein
LSEPHGPVSAVSVSPDNRRVLAACGDQTALLWDATTATVVLTLKGHSDAVEDAAFSPDGLRIITGSDDTTAKVWDANIGEELLTLKAHTGFLNGVAISSDGQRIAACAGDGTVTIWTAATPDEVTRWKDSEKEATERLAALRSEREAAAERDRLSRLEDPGALKVWLVLSPLGFTNQSAAAALAEEQIPKEARLHPRVGESIAGGMKWRPVQLYDNLIDFNDLNSSQASHSAAYAVYYVQSAADQSGLSLLIGSTDGSLVYLNGREVYRREEPRSYVRDQDVVTG